MIFSNSFGSVSVSDLKALLSLEGEDPSSRRLILVDVRENWEVDICSLEGSIHIPLTHLEEQMDKIPQGCRIVVLCHHGMRSRRGVQILLSHGFPEVANLEGGIDAWAKEIDLTMRRY